LDEKTFLNCIFNFIFRKYLRSSILTYLQIYNTFYFVLTKSKQPSGVKNTLETTRLPSEYCLLINKSAFFQWFKNILWLKAFCLLKPYFTGPFEKDLLNICMWIVKVSPDLRHSFYFILVIKTFVVNWHIENRGGFRFASEKQP